MPRPVGSKNNKDAMVHLSLYVPKDVLKYFKVEGKKIKQYYTSLARDALVEYVERKSK